MGKQNNRWARWALGLLAVLTVLIVAACGDEGAGGAEGEVSTVADKITSAEREPTVQEPGRTSKIGTDFPIKRSKMVSAEIDEKGGVEEYVKYLALEEIDPFYAQQFTKLADSVPQYGVQQYGTQQYLSGEGDYYTSPRLVSSDKPLETGGCGAANNERGTFYCPADNTIYSMTKGQSKEADENGPFAIPYTIAHEWGHHVQHLLGYFREDQTNKMSNSRALENHADCLAGVWARSYYLRGHLDRRAILEGINMTYDTGDFQPRDDGGGWGTPEERVRWFLTGYTSVDFSECSRVLR